MKINGGKHRKHGLFKLEGGMLSLFDWVALGGDATVSSVGRGFRGFTLAHNVESKEEVDRLFLELEAKGSRL